MSVHDGRRRLVLVHGGAATRAERENIAYLRLYADVYGRREPRVRAGCGRRRRHLHAVP